MCNMDIINRKQASVARTQLLDVKADFQIVRWCVVERKFQRCSSRILVSSLSNQTLMSL